MPSPGRRRTGVLLAVTVPIPSNLWLLPGLLASGSGPAIVLSVNHPVWGGQRAGSRRGSGVRVVGGLALIGAAAAVVAGPHAGRTGRPEATGP